VKTKRMSKSACVLTSTHGLRVMSTPTGSVWQWQHCLKLLHHLHYHRLCLSHKLPELTLLLPVSPRVSSSGQASRGPAADLNMRSTAKPGEEEGGGFCESGGGDGSGTVFTSRAHTDVAAYGPHEDLEGRCHCLHQHKIWLSQEARAAKARSDCALKANAWWWTTQNRLRQLANHPEAGLHAKAAALAAAKESTLCLPTLSVVLAPPNVSKFTSHDAPPTLVPTLIPLLHPPCSLPQLMLLGWKRGLVARTICLWRHW
jgi:hypothetical protein